MAKGSVAAEAPVSEKASVVPASGSLAVIGPPTRAPTAAFSATLRTAAAIVGASLTSVTVTASVQLPVRPAASVPSSVSEYVLWTS